jgi:UDP-glucose 4-epimerase
LKKILITGGAGFIGSHLAERCVLEGNYVTIIDDLSRGKKENIESILNKIEFYQEDILTFSKLNLIIKNSDVIFHLAALSRVIPCIEKPELCFINNIQITELIARICSNYHKKIIFSSSREVYGQGIFFPVNETHPLIPENPYGASKVSSEKIINAYAHCYNFNYGILRLANVYGPRDHDRVIPTFINKSITNEKLILFGGNQIIDFIFIKDVVDAFYKSIDVENNFIVNIGSGMGINITELAKIIQNYTKSNNNIIIGEKRCGEVEKYISDNKMAQDILNWSPKVNFIDGIQDTINSITIERVLHGQILETK